MSDLADALRSFLDDRRDECRTGEEMAVDGRRYAAAAGMRDKIQAFDEVENFIDHYEEEHDG